MPYRFLADAVLLCHLAVVAFIVAGLAAIVVGNSRGWGWVNRWTFRLVHLVAIGVVVLQSWLGRVCPLTTLEAWLRAQAGQGTYGGSFVEHWVQRLLFYDAPAWAFTLAYTLFGLMVLVAWWRYPPRRRRVASSRAACAANGGPTRGPRC